MRTDPLGLKFFPYLVLLVGILPLLLGGVQPASLMAHDEGYYAQQARWILETGDWITLQWWGTPLFDRTIGLQWLIAASYHLLGVSEFSARFPSLIAGIASVLLTYAIGSRWLHPGIAWLGATLLGLMSLWIQYSRLATQDMTLLALELLGIWALLQVEGTKPQVFGGQSLSNRFRGRHRHTRILWGMLVGSTVGLGFMVKGFMIALPIVALLPYLIVTQIRHRHLTNPGLYAGVLLGGIPAGLWLGLSGSVYGWLPLQQLFGKLLLLSQDDWHGGGPFYYLWNIPVNAFPWVFLGVTGAFLLLQEPRRFLRAPNDCLVLLLGYPLILLIELSLFKTRTPYYALQVLPFVALLAGVALSRCLSLFRDRRVGGMAWPGWFSFALGGIGLIVSVLAAGLTWMPTTLGSWASEIVPFRSLAWILGLGWLSLPLLWGMRGRWSSLERMGQLWLSAWILTPWLVLLTAAQLGLFSDFSPQIKAALQQSSIADILLTHPVDCVLPETALSGEDHKTWVLLSYYSPHLGKARQQVTEVPLGGYAWVSPPQVAVLESSLMGSSVRTLADIQGWHLVQAQ